MTRRPDGWPDVMTVEQVAAYLQLNKLTVYKFVREGSIPASRLGKSYRIRKADVDQFLDSQKLRAGGRAVRAARPVAVVAAKRSDEVVAPQRQNRPEMRDPGSLTGNPMEWIIRVLH